MAGKVGFITGAARGLGREIALALGQDGHRLYLVDILADRLEATAAELREAGHEVIAQVVDVSVHQQCVDAVADCVARFGELAVLVNCAAIMRMEPFTDTPVETWNRILAVNLSGPFFLMQAALPHIISARGNIVNVASSNGLMGTAYTGPYSSTKAALISLTKTLAIEYAEEPIRVNAVCPGPMATEIADGVRPPPTIKHDKIVRYSGLRGLGDAGDVAKVVAFLASDAAVGVHGAIWTADLGTSAG
ncbi:SDR family oxidoreductase [Novosphingobium sp. G106]|uniref:SDR family NAD(P)-dependent oxidoreductase n=1 Tax=Novosphingobium sp. G106 TaxID=2849500 RepID=UPI001C2CE61F|nr:SDR family oxidoreductase [Novosphingobium sp. G106]MBV1686771.1 SDR family oxidoreductase [Novosphingobium sp. G106]